MSITHGNYIGFVSVAATSVNMTETSELKSREDFSKQVSAGLFSGPAWEDFRSRPLNLSVLLDAIHLCNVCNYPNDVFDMLKSQHAKLRC